MKRKKHSNISPHKKNSKFYRLAIGAFIITNIIWGISYPVYKWSFGNIHPYTLAFIRFLVPVILIAVFASKYIKAQAKHIPYLLAIGLCDITFGVGLSFFGLTKTESINGPILESAAPVFLIIGSIFMFRERPTRKLLMSNLIGLTGVFLIVMQPIIQPHQNTAVWGNLLIVGAVISSVMGTLLSKKIRPYYHPITILFWSFFIGTLSFFPLFVSDVWTHGFLPNLNYQGIVGILYATILSSMVAYFFYYWAVKYIMASEISMFTYVDPVAALFIAPPLLHEYPTVLFFVGALMVFGGIFFAEGRIHWHPIHKLLQA